MVEPKAKLHLCCRANQFECACGSQPRCIPSNATNDSVADCQDASDEVPYEEIACGDGTPSRTNKHIQNSEVKLCSKAESRSCGPSSYGRICIAVRGTPQCVCQLGYFRPRHMSACVPIERLPLQTISTSSELDAQLPTRNALDETSQQLSSFNCTELFHELNQIYPNLFLFGGTGRKLATPEIVSTEAEGTSRVSRLKQVTIKLNENSNEEQGNTPGLVLRDEKMPDSGFNIDPKPITKETETTHSLRDELSECDPSNRSSCSEKDKICARIMDTVKNETKAAGKCVVPINECLNRTLNDCDRNARCMDNDLGYECLCPEGYIDTSQTPSHWPGRSCRKLVNECRSPLQNDCDRNSDCIDEPLGFTCRCREGFFDNSDQGAKRPGRKCIKLANECNNGEGKCDRMAICTDMKHGYQCRCPDGYLDNSPNPLEPGRCLEIAIHQTVSQQPLSAFKLWLEPFANAEEDLSMRINQIQGQNALEDTRKQNILYEKYLVAPNLTLTICYPNLPLNLCYPKYGTIMYCLNGQRRLGENCDGCCTSWLVNLFSLVVALRAKKNAKMKACCCSSSAKEKPQTVAKSLQWSVVVR
ncbi:calcium-binding EGF domain-containing protein [Ditylenchus destructor]|nr:calcium-binding EGF domain-containing protein [Ditylenchus destructor]